MCYVVPSVLAPHIKPRNEAARLRVGTLEGDSICLKVCSLSLHFLSLDEMFLKENLCRSRMKAFLVELALDSFICRARLTKTSSIPVSFLADVSKKGQEKVSAIFFPS